MCRCGTSEAVLLLRFCRAHYSAGQIHALQQGWQQSEDSYKKCAELSADPQARDQSLYCVGVACHQQGKFGEALAAYGAAAAAGGHSLRPMLALGQVRALQQLGRHVEALAVAEQFLASDDSSKCPAAVVDALRAAAATAASSQPGVATAQRHP
jgi:tetratricopeptide (TPR) repeat protein